MKVKKKRANLTILREQNDRSSWSSVPTTANLESRVTNCATGVARDKESGSSTWQKFQVGQVSERSGISRLSRMAMSDLV